MPDSGRLCFGIKAKRLTAMETRGANELTSPLREIPSPCEGQTVTPPPYERDPLHPEWLSVSSGWILRRCRARGFPLSLKSSQKPLRGPYERCLKSPLRGTCKHCFKTTIRPKKSRHYGGWLCLVITPFGMKYIPTPYPSLLPVYLCFIVGSLIPSSGVL